MDERKNQRQPYTANEIAETGANVTETVKEVISSVVEAYLVEFQAMTQTEAREVTAKVLPVILALIEDGIYTGKRIAEKELVEEFHRIADATKSGLKPLGHTN